MFCNRSKNVEYDTLFDNILSCYCYCHTNMLSLSYWEILERLEEIAQSFKELSNFEYTVFFCLFCFNFFLFFFSIFFSILLSSRLSICQS